MKSELIVDVQAAEVSIALLEDGRLVSLQKEQRNIAYAVGDIYLAKVKKLMPGLNAAFVNVGYEKDAFLHYLDLGPHFSTYSEYLKKLAADPKRLPALSQMKLLPEIDKHGSVADTLETGRELLVQIVKEPISSKGPRLTSELTFTGRYMVLTPFADKVSVSQKIKSAEEKLRLRKLVESMKQRNYGVIIRTSAEGKTAKDLCLELQTLQKAFEDCCAKAQKSQAPALVFEEESRIVGMLRDVFSPSFENIYVNDPDVYAQIKTYVSLIAPERADIVKLYNRPEPIFDSFGITRQIKSSFGKTVSFKNGAYIIIEHTEALHVIDVNSGNRSKATNDQETNALEVNLRAADEIARQLRLRDMGGIIVVDFIDMAKAEHRQELYDHMREIMANDRARHNILPLSKFGLMQITRQRVRPALDVTVAETCPSCFGKGEVQPSLLFTDTLYEKLEYIVNDLGVKDFILYVHPFVDAYIKKGWLFGLYHTWRRKLGAKFRILADESLAYLEYKVVDKERNVLNLREEKDLNQSSATKTETKARTRGAEEQQQDDKASRKKAAKPKSQPQPTRSFPPASPTALLPAAEQPQSDARPRSKAAAPQPGAKASAAEAGADQNQATAAPEAEAAGENAGETPKLSKSQRRRRARKRSKEAAKAALEAQEGAEEAAEAPEPASPEDFKDLSDSKDFKDPKDSAGPEDAEAPAPAAESASEEEAPDESASEQPAKAMRKPRTRKPHKPAAEAPAAAESAGESGENAQPAEEPGEAGKPAEAAASESEPAAQTPEKQE